MNTDPALLSEQPTEQMRYRHLLVAVDSSEHSNRAFDEAVNLAAASGARLTGTHVYAAQMHDVRFKQMEGGLPEKYREEDELEHQRDVHDDLITRGLSIITDSYLDQVDLACSERNIELRRRPLEGKNYSALVREINCGEYDLVIMGALGVGAVPGSRLGTVCGRTVRRSTIDALVIRDPQRSLAEGPIVVAVDGSPRAYGGLLSALMLAEQWDVPVKVIAAFDPYFHYVAFNRIAGVLSEEAGKVFRFKDQEKLHEEIIDSGLAKIYEGHLAVATAIARDAGHEIETKLLDGKPHAAIEKYVRQERPSLLVIGKVGIHADPELDIGGNTENLLRNVDCSLLLSQREHRPRVDVLAEVTTSWTKEADERMTRVPAFAQNMARMAILRYAQQRGHTVITARIVEEATAELMPHHAERRMADLVAAHETGDSGNPLKAPDWTPEADARLQGISDDAVRDNVKRRAEKKARTQRATAVTLEHVSEFLDEVPANPSTTSESGIHWQAEALARLARVPEGFMRDGSRRQIEALARENGIASIDLAVAEAGLARARQQMEAMMRGPAPRTDAAQPSADLDNTNRGNALTWDAAAEARLERVPEGFMRTLTRQRVEAFAHRTGVDRVTLDVVEGKFAEWRAGSERQQRELPWDDAAWQRVARIPDVVRGMIVKEVERCARELGATRVTADTLEKASGTWSRTGLFHSESAPGQYGDDD